MLRMDGFHSAARTQDRAKDLEHHPIFPALFAAAKLRDRGKLMQVFKLSSDTLLSADLSTTVKKAADHNKRLVAPDRISRSLLQVDATLCCLMKQSLASSGGPLYLWADSSPQHGTDWLLSTLLSIDREALVPTMEAAQLLMRTAESFASLDDDDVCDTVAMERDRAGLVLRQNMRFHRQLPMGLGSGHTTVEHKLKALLLKIVPEAQLPASPAAILARIRAVCTDLGTESAMSDVSNLSAEDLLPAWMQPDLLQPDVGDQGQDPAHDQDENLSELSEFVMPLCILSAGTCHILNNMAASVHTALSYWETWLPGFKAVAYLMHYDHLRQRLVAHLIHGTRWSHFAGVFKHGCPMHADWRWGTIGTVLVRLLEVQGTLCLVWDPIKFAARSAARDQDLTFADKEGLNTTKLNAAIRSPKFWAYCKMLKEIMNFVSKMGSWTESCKCHGWLKSTRAENGTTEHSSAAEKLQQCRREGGRAGPGWRPTHTAIAPTLNSSPPTRALPALPCPACPALPCLPALPPWPCSACPALPTLLGLPA